MKINVKQLKDAMKVAVRFVDNRPTIPVTAMVELDFTESNLRITTNSLDKIFIANIEGEYEPCSVLIDAQRFNTFLQNVSDEYIECSADERSFTVKRKGGNAKFIRSLEPFPETPKIEPIHTISFDAETLTEAFKAILCGTDDESVGQTWQNVANLKVSDNQFTFSSSDTKRIVQSRGECKGEGTINIPIKAIRTVLGFLNGDVTVNASINHLVFDCGYTYIFRKLDATFPNMDAFFNNAKFEEGFTTDAQVLGNALGLVKSVITDRVPSVRWTLDDKVTFSAKSQEVGHIEESLDIEPKLQLVTGYNNNFLLPVIKQLEGEITCEFWDNGKESPFLQIRSKHLTDSTFVIGSLAVRD